MKIVVVLVALSACACGGKVKSPQSTAPNYSTTPCAENCGNDATCNSSCTPTSNSNPPITNMGH